MGAFLARLDAFLLATKRAEGGVSDALFGSSRKSKDLRAGRGVSVYTLADAETALARLAAEAGVTLPEGDVPQKPFPDQRATPTGPITVSGEREDAA